MNIALIIGGANGIGLAVAIQLAQQCKKVIIIDRAEPNVPIPQNVLFKKENLLLTDYKWLNEYQNVDTLFYSAGFGRVTPFETIEDKEIDNSFIVNTIAPFKIIKYFMPMIKSDKDFFCGVMVSIAGRIASPLFSIYSSTKAALFRGIEAINTELEMSGIDNRILEISPGSIKGTSFNGQPSDLSKMHLLSEKIISAMQRKDTILIPEYDEIFKNVIARYSSDPHKFAVESYKYKKNSNRLQNKPQLTIGYLSGTFDLFHIGHLNLLKRARQYCDYLVVGVHKDASHKGKNTFIPFEERVAILESIKYVDKVIESEKEDSDVYSKEIVKYNKLFVGSDYKGTPRFKRYEEFFSDKGVEIIYFPYTQGTSSTQLRAALQN